MPPALDRAPLQLALGQGHRLVSALVVDGEQLTTHPYEAHGDPVDQDRTRRLIDEGGQVAGPVPSHGLSDP